MFWTFQALLVFALNLADAFLTLYWVRNGLAEEANSLMNVLLSFGDAAFLGTKIALGLCATIVLWLYRDMTLAKFGLVAVSGAYLFVMSTHLATGLMVLGK